MWKRILLSISICCITFLCVEGTLRVLERYSKKIRFYTNNSFQTQTMDVTSNLQTLLSSLPAALWPGAAFNGFTVNEKGFLTPNLTYDNPKNTKRLVLIGDSNGVGRVPYPESYIRLLEQRIRNENNIPFDAINLSVGGIGPRIENELLGLEGAQYHPNIILLSFTICNDFSDDQQAIKRYSDQSQKKITPPFWLYQSRVFSLLRNSLLIFSNNYGKMTHKTDNAASPGTYVGETYDDAEPGMDTQTYLKQAAEQLNIYLADGSAYTEIADIQQAIHSMKQIADTIGAKFFVVIVPSPVQINTALLPQELPYFDKNGAQLDLTLPQQKIKTILTTEHISYLDLLEPWATDAAAVTYFHPNDDHLNFAGNQAVANLLFPIINQLLKTN